MAYDDRIVHGFKQNETEGVVYFTIPAFTKSGICAHAFSSRIGGVSEGVYESLCFSLSREKNIEHFRENTRLFAGACGVDVSRITVVNYAHGDGIYAIGKDDAGMGIFKESTIPQCDALVCDNNEVAAMTMHADCIPLFVLDTKNRIGAVAHSGWRGVVGRLPAKIVGFFKEKYSSSASDILYGIGPHISKCCFEVGEDVASVFEKDFGEGALSVKNGRYHVDMQYSVLRQLEEACVLPENITVSDLCTSCRKDLFYSHRRDKGNTGAMASLMQML